MPSRSGTGCRVRVATARDAAPLTELAWDLLNYHAGLTPEGTVPLQTYGEFEAVWAPYLHDFLLEPDSEAMVAELNGRLVGYSLLALRDRPPIFVGPPDVIIAELLVAPEHRRAGIGAALMNAAYEWGRKRGAGYARLHVYEANADAMGFYEHEGFIPHERVLLKRIDGGDGNG